MNYEFIESMMRIQLLKVGDVVTEKTVADILKVLGPIPKEIKLEIHFDKNGQPHHLWIDEGGAE